MLFIICNFANMKFVNMKLNKYIYISIVGIVSVMVLQVMWICSTFLYAETRMVEDVDESIVKSMFTEVYDRFVYVPAGTKIAGAPDVAYPKFHGIEYVENGVFNASHKDVDFKKLGRCFQQNIQNKGWNYDYIIYKVENNRRIVVDKSYSQPFIVINKISSQCIPIRIDKSIGIQVELLNPIDLFFKHLGLIISSSIIIGLLVLLCVVRLYKAIRFLQERARVNKVFTYSMIHDMKTPLSTIQLGLTALNNEKIINDEDKRAKYLSVISTETQHAYQLIMRILTISKSESKKLELHKEIIELPSLLSGIKNNFLSRDRKTVSFELNLKSQYIYADIEYIREVFYNLIDNSIKYSEGDVEISISSEKVDKGVAIYVRDNGIGISKADQKIIFDKYERASASKRTFKKGGAPGFGLGLTYVFLVLDAHHGMIGVDSELGKYTEFTIFLPDQGVDYGGAMKN